MGVPTEPFMLMTKVYRKVFPIVHKELEFWKERAEQIPDTELRQQAVTSIEHKTFHCEGGAILGLLSGSEIDGVVKFIVAYQTISDYLDNLCDRSVSLDPNDFAALHESMMDSLTVDAPLRDYYRYRETNGDGEYLADLVKTCQHVLKEMKHYPSIKTFLLELCQYYCDLQIHKHVKLEEREERLVNWFEQHRHQLPTMDWHEFSACSGSTLGIFCLVSYAHREDYEPMHGDLIKEGYFPYIQGLHILLDYFIDQEEDLLEGDLNFCEYYQSEEELFTRLLHFLQEADKRTDKLPDRHFHKLINRGLLGVYLSDEKVWNNPSLRKLAFKMIRSSGLVSMFFYANGVMYRNVRRTFKKVS
ncbi:tetraprenyl-beta-curcumene synthase [Bacillus coahuilensis p1.1.43]|uniref:Tetraprenyl-beta-curcumene synthase n=1 Tax=Bacillus coahuilensis p1.1.43 TaxID=1150625 RepID=A0A147K6C4_9BACI|nr:tetraprenyl-beta-curcumene synthase family protein [Bacillus coahuilensis]KUP05428.1 tetraprenyl-beta-curcumene synthase [Bacillus coahuilensis p1.1.43]